MKLGNTAIYCLKLLAGNGWLNPRTIARTRWPSSRQLLKKEVTVRGHLRRLVRQGYLACANDYFHVTDAGRLAAKSASQQDRPAALRIA